MVNIEKVIGPIVAEILSQINKKVLIFLSGGTVNAESLLKVLRDFELINYSIVLSRAAKEILDERLLESLDGKIIESMDVLAEELDKAEIVLIPIMTRNTLSKVALGISDNLVTTGISRAIMTDKDIILVRDSYNPKNRRNISEGLSNNEAYNSMILNHEKTLESYGIKLVDSEEFKESIRGELKYSKLETRDQVERDKSSKRIDSSVLTFNDISQICNDGKITVKRGTIITPLAKDYIYNNNIEVELY